MADPTYDMSQTSLRLQPVKLSGLNERQDIGRAFAAGIRIPKQPVINA